MAYAERSRGERGRGRDGRGAVLAYVHAQVGFRLDLGVVWRV
jgi:hypothetical protein